MDIDFDELEDELEVVIPNIYRMFIEAIEQKGLDLKKYGIYHNTQSILKGNFKLRAELGESNPKWLDCFFDFGVGDGCGNYFFLVATDEDDDLVKLWAHDPSGIEEVSSGSEFFKDLLEEICSDFKGRYQYRFQGNGTW